MAKLRCALYSFDWLDDYYLKTKFVKRTTWSHEFEYYFYIMFYYLLIGIEFILLILYNTFILFTYFLDRIIIKPIISRGLDCDKKCKKIIEKLIIKFMNAADSVNDYPEHISF